MCIVMCTNLKYLCCQLDQDMKHFHLLLKVLALFSCCLFLVQIVKAAGAEITYLKIRAEDRWHTQRGLTDIAKDPSTEVWESTMNHEASRD